MKKVTNQSMAEEAEVLFEPASWLIKIDFINQFILNNNVLISVLGDTGSGKTTFATLLQQKLDHNIQPVMLTTTPLFDRQCFLDSLCDMLDLESGLSIADIAAQVNSRKTCTLVIIDDAEQLPETFVRELLDALQPQEGNGFFHACLFSDFSLVKMTSRLAREAYKDMIHSLELQPLNEDETKAYVLDCMSQLREEPLEINDAWFHQFYQMTEGNIVSINTQMMGFFSRKATTSSPWRKKLYPYGAMTLMAFAAVGVGYLLFSPPGTDSQALTYAENAIDSTQIELPLTSDIPNYQIAAIHQPMQMVSLQKAEFLIQNEEDAGNTADSAVDESLVLMDKVVSIPKVILPSEQKRGGAAVVKHAAVHLPEIVVKKTVAVSKPHITIAPGKYTIQLVASRNKQELVRLAKRYSSSRLKVRRFNNQGITWYVLTQGDYVQQQLAKNAMTKLPGDLSQFKAWVRQTRDLKDVG